MGILLDSQGRRGLKNGVVLGPDGTPCCCELETIDGECSYCPGQTMPRYLTISFVGINQRGCQAVSVWSQKWEILGDPDRTFVLEWEPWGFGCLWIKRNISIVQERRTGYYAGALCQDGNEQWGPTTVDTTVSYIVGGGQAGIRWSGVDHLFYNSSVSCPTGPLTINNVYTSSTSQASTGWGGTAYITPGG